VTKPALFVDLELDDALLASPLWEHMLEHEPGMYGVRLSSTSSIVQALRAAKRHDDVRAVSGAAMRHDPSPEMSAVLSEA
jgi:hypothetical protein